LLVLPRLALIEETGAEGENGRLLVSSVAGWATIVSTWSVLLAFGFAAAVGVFFGLFPAQRAAALDPIIPCGRNRPSPSSTLLESGGWHRRGTSGGARLAP
jgi:ABC-type nitrate/sulfonate/bicarbonate transport system permease component